MRLGIRSLLACTLMAGAISVDASAAPSAAARAHREEGLRLLEAKRYVDAITALQKALDRAPEYADALVDLGNARIGLGEFDAAAKAFAKALSIDPELPIARYNLAYSLRRAGKLDKAAAAYRVYLQGAPEDADAHYGLAETLRASGDLLAAAEAYDRYALAERRPDRGTWIDKAKQLAAQLRAELGVTAAAAPPAGGREQAPGASTAVPAPAVRPPDQRPPAFASGLRKLKEGDYDGAQVDLEKASAAAPDDSIVLAALAGAQLGSKRPEAAAGNYRRALMTATPEAISAIHFGLGEALRALGNNQEASEAFRRVLDDPKTSAEVRRLAEQRLAATR